ncbi:Response regulator receiver domain-containing protein [Malonomonas rubra DSM 5091]|uniref:histidine kinase n=1 Tax=Malonomonas rubra DSM 5091 TaxID=1122189 RepID=A0A1M6B515_MALRU|nr:ATP-binding protein [Malonomonas rubra]SHI43668.1 Response regulator receiver domain-containing protein [Malonomonas rubra DSM 5091]
MSDVVLVLHSNPVTSASFASTLDEIGFTATLANDAEAACKMIRISRPDVILLDGEMALSDPTLCRRLRTCSPEKRLPLILLIPQGAEDVSRYLCGADADDYLCQPCQISELQARLMLCLAANERVDVRPLPHIDFSFLCDLSNLALSELSHSEIMQQVVSAVAGQIEVNRCSILLLGQNSDDAMVMASSDDLGVNGLHVVLDRYPEIREAIKSRRPLLIDNVFEHPLMEAVRQHLQHGVTNSILVLPMIDREHIVGVMVLRSARPISGFSEDEVNFCQLVANMATSALRMADVSALDGKVRSRVPVSTTVSNDGHVSQLDIAAKDLRVLVSVVDGYCMLFNETADRVAPGQNEIISGLMAGNRKLVDMASDLLDFSQLNSGSYRLDFAEHDICQLLGAVVQELAPIMSQGNIHLLNDCLNQEKMVVCDEHAIKRVFYNILNNAIKYTPEGGEICLGLRELDGEVRIFVRDNGPGIEPEKIASLFDEYTTVSSSDPKAGSGLGLAICEKIISAHHGRIWAESFLGQGSCFTFCLPT